MPRSPTRPPLHCRHLDDPCGAGDSEQMVRVLAALTGAALLVLLLEVAGSSRALPAVSLAAVYAVGAVAGFRVVSGRRRAFRAAYVGAELVLGFAVFQLGGPGVGATLLLLVLV